LEIEDRKWAEEELLRSEAYLSEAQRLSHTGSFGWDVLSGEIYWSDETFRIFELEPKTKITTDLIVQRTHPDDRQAVQQLVERASSESSEFAFEHRLLMPDRSIKYLRVVGRPLQEEGRRSEFVGAVTDITERKRVEEELRRSEAYLAEAQRLSHTGSFGCKFSSGEMFWSEETFAIFGYNRDTAPATEAILQRVHPEDKVRVQERMHRAASDGKRCDLEYRLLMPDDSVKHVHVVAHAAKGEPGRFEFVGAVVDVTEAKRAEEELRVSERKYRHLVDTTPAFINTALPNGDLDFFNRGWLEYVGLPLKDLLGWGWTCMIHPEDVETIVPKWRAAVETGEPFVGESRVRRADGEYRWFLHREEPLRNEAGEIVKWYGSSIEIEERKIAEQQIRAKEIELQQIVNLSPQHIGVFAPSGEPLYLNHAGLEYFGATMWRADAGQPEAAHPWPGSRFDLVHQEDRKHFVSKRKKGFLEGRCFEHEARLLRHDGRFRCFLVRFAPLKDERGNITRWIGTGTDIEDRKRAEEEIKKENIVLRDEIDKTSMFEQIVGVSAPLQSVLTDVSKVAPTDSTVLITGETGTGKELVARAIHKRSQRSARAFVSVNCAAIPSSLLASELFGHEKGAFTGATQRRQGRFELAEGGTIFLDEIGELPAEVQIALLRVLQEREFEAVGSSRPIRADVRVIAATNRDLESAIAEKTFRSDLFYRLNVFPILVPPLRERPEDIPLLVEYFIHRFAKRAGKKINRISKKTLNIVESYGWPGNVRELQNVVERAVIVSDSNELYIDERWLSGRRTKAPVDAQPNQRTSLRSLTTSEKEAIEAALMKCKGRVSGPFGAASRLGLPSTTLESKIKALKIDKRRFKPLATDSALPR
ncbi:MAG TPA: sigma 54-interacting transcriptional regulator, partial [Blastocatellia bacterium]|nr:sigma 54-interacting transcriptional regulator [Blastocatellia bacterium]